MTKKRGQGQQADAVESSEAGWSGLLMSLAGELEAQVDRVRMLIGGAHWGEDGSFKEVLVRQLLREQIPERFAVGTGFIHWAAGVVSGQVDVLIWDRMGPAPYLRKGEFVIVAPECVAAIIEVKTTLTRQSLREAMRHLHSEPLRTYANLRNRTPIRAIVAFSHKFGKVHTTPARSCFEVIATYYRQEYPEQGRRGVMSLREPVVRASSKDPDDYRWSEVAHPRFYNLIDAVSVFDELHIEQCRVYYDGKGDAAAAGVGHDPGLVAYGAGQPGTGQSLARFVLQMRDLLNRQLDRPVGTDWTYRMKFQPPLADPGFCVFGPEGGVPKGIFGTLPQGSVWRPGEGLWEMTGPPVLVDIPKRAGELYEGRLDNDE